MSEGRARRNISCAREECRAVPNNKAADKDKGDDIINHRDEEACDQQHGVEDFDEGRNERCCCCPTFTSNAQQSPPAGPARSSYMLDREARQSQQAPSLVNVVPTPSTALLNFEGVGNSNPVGNYYGGQVGGDGPTTGSSLARRRSTPTWPGPAGAPLANEPSPSRTALRMRGDENQGLCDGPRRFRGDFVPAQLRRWTVRHHG